MVAGGIVALLAMLALAVDLGYWRNQQRQEQSAADSAAMAGSIALYYPTTAATPAPVQVKSAATLAAAKNGYTDDSGVTTAIAVNNPPQSGTHTADATAVEVIVSKKQPVFFAGIFGLPSQTVTARAVASHVLDGVPACFVQLNPLSLVNLNAGSINAMNCSVAANGPIKVGGSVTATGISYYGTVNPAIGTAYAGTETNVPTQITDPCLRIPGCAYLSQQPYPLVVPSNATPVSSPMSAPSSPGYLYVQGPITTATFFNPGIYYIYGGISASVAGTGVTIVNVDGIAKLGGASSTTVTAPATGPSAGVAFYQPSSNKNSFSVGGSTTTWNGLFYAPAADFTSNGKLDNYSELVVGGITVTGSKLLTINPSLSPGLSAVQAAQGTTHAALAE